MKSGHLTNLRFFLIRTSPPQNPLSLCRTGLLPGTDWDQLTRDGLWPAWAPPLLHLVARGLFLILRPLLLRLPSLLLSRCLRGNNRVVVGTLVAMWCPGLILCSALGLLLSLAAYTLKVLAKRGMLSHIRRCSCLFLSISDCLQAVDGRQRQVQSLLLCLVFLSLPSLCSWIKNIRCVLQCLVVMEMMSSLSSQVLVAAVP